MNEDHLIEALQSGKVLSCGLDVFEKEPNVPKELRENFNVLMLPHMGAHNDDTSKETERVGLENVMMAFKENRLMSLVLEQRENAKKVAYLKALDEL